MSPRSMKVWVIEEVNEYEPGSVEVVCVDAVSARRWLERRRRLEIREQKKNAIEWGEYDREWEPSVGEIKEGETGVGRFIKFEIAGSSTTYFAQERKVIT